MKLIDTIRQQKLWLQKGQYVWGGGRGVYPYMPKQGENEALAVHQGKFDENCRKVAAALDVFIDQEGFVLSRQVYDALYSFNTEVEEQARAREKELCILYAHFSGDGMKIMSSPLFKGTGNPYLRSHPSIKFSPQFGHFLGEAVKRNFSLPVELELGLNRPNGFPRVLSVDAHGTANLNVPRWEVVMYKDEEIMIKAIGEKLLPQRTADYQI